MANKKMTKEKSLELHRKIFRKKYLYDSLEDNEEKVIQINQW